MHIEMCTGMWIDEQHSGGWILNSCSTGGTTVPDPSLLPPQSDARTCNITHARTHMCANTKRMQSALAKCMQAHKRATKIGGCGLQFACKGGSMWVAASSGNRCGCYGSLGRRSVAWVDDFLIGATAMCVVSRVCCSHCIQPPRCVRCVFGCCVDCVAVCGVCARMGKRTFS